MPMSFIKIFMEIYNAGAAFIIIFLIGQIIFMMRRVDKDILKTRVFLNQVVLERTWIYISIAGASFALNALIKLAVSFTVIGSFIKSLYAIEITQIIFLISFILAVYNWYMFIGSFVKPKV